MTFSTSRRLGFGACDPSGIAYFPAYLDLLVGVLEEFFEHIGAPWPALLRDRRIGTPTVKLDLTFERPGFHGDLLQFELIVTRIGRSSLDLHHDVTANGELLWSAEQTIVATSIETHTSCGWPDDVRAALTRCLEANDA